MNLFTLAFGFKVLWSYSGSKTFIVAVSVLFGGYQLSFI